MEMQIDVFLLRQVEFVAPFKQDQLEVFYEREGVNFASGLLQMKFFLENVKMVLFGLQGVQTEVFVGNQAGSFGEPQGDAVGGFLVAIMFVNEPQGVTFRILPPSH